MKAFVFKATCCVLLFTQAFFVCAQVAAVKFTVHTPAIGNGEKVYLAGSFNYWHEADSLYRMNDMGNGIYTITIPVFEKREYFYKYTLGTWNKVEVAKNDSNISNRRFTSVNGKKITDAVVKWKQPETAGKDSSAQLKKIIAMKDSLMAKLQPELDSIQALLKLYMQNMLQEKPDKKVHQELDEKAIQKIGNVYSNITLLLWNIVAGLSPEQKQQVTKSVSQPANGDFINAFLNAINAAVK